MGSALTNGSSPINHPNFEPLSINVFIKDRREHSPYSCTSGWTYCLRLALNPTSSSHPKLLFLHCLRGKETWATQTRVLEQIDCHRYSKWHTEEFWRKLWFQILHWKSKRWEVFQKVQSLPQWTLKIPSF